MKAGSIRVSSGRAGLLLVCAAMVPGYATASNPPTEAESAAATGSGADDPEAARIAQELEALKAADAAPLTPDEAVDAKQVGKRVRWAGGVYSINPSEKGVCLTILYARSGDDGAPRWAPEPTYQNFVACAAGTYDAELVQDHSNVTIVGTLTGKQYIGMGGGGGEGPVIAIERLYRWSDCLAGDDSAVCRQGFLEPAPIADEPDAKGAE